MRTILLGMIIYLLTGCASPYQPSGFGGGYSEIQLDTNIFRVSFGGNGYTGTERAEELALLRSADLTLTKGFSYFIIIDNNSRLEHSTYTTPTQSYTTANATSYGNSIYGTANTATYGGQTFLISKPSITNTIACFKGKPKVQGIAYNAKFLCDSLGKKYQVTCESQKPETPEKEEHQIKSAVTPSTKTNYQHVNGHSW